MIVVAMTSTRSKSFIQALSNADILTETILDDLLLETAHELSRCDLFLIN